MQTYDPANDSILEEYLGPGFLEASPLPAIRALASCREDRHEAIRGMVLMIGALTDSARRELYTALGVHPL